MRLIDADALKKTIDKKIYRHDTIDHVFQIIDNEPTIDAVSVVRCKECKWYSDMWGCTEHDEVYLVTDPDDFCSIGERKDK